MNREVLDRLPHRKIQKLAKRANVKANGSTEDIILRMLAKHAEGVPSPKTTVKPLPAAQAVKEEETEERDLAGVATRASTSAGLSGLQVAREDGGVSQSGRIPYSVSDDVDSRIGRHLDMSRARTCIRSRAPSPVASTSHGASATRIDFQQTGPGSSSQASFAMHPSAAIHPVDEHRERLGLRYWSYPPPAQSQCSCVDMMPTYLTDGSDAQTGAAGSPWAGLSGVFAYTAPTDSWSSAAPHAEMRVPRLVPAQWPALVAEQEPAQRAPSTTAHRVPDSAARSAAAPTRRPVDLHEMKAAIDKALEAIAAEIGLLTEEHLVNEQHDPAPLGQQRDREAGVRRVSQDVTTLHRSNEDELLFRKSLAAEPHRPTKRPFDDRESDAERDPRAPKRRRS